MELFDKDGNELNINDVISQLPLSTLNRVEVIDGDGRSYVNWEKSNDVSISFQDDNRTLKVFISTYTEDMLANDDIPNYGELIEIGDFIDCCEGGAFIDSDGYGHLAMADKVNLELEISPSGILRGDYDKRYTHVWWLNN